MKHRQHESLKRVKNVEREFLAIQFASKRFLDVAKRDPTVTNQDFSPQLLEEAIAKLDGTYLIRLFAEFEACLRMYWESVRTTEAPFRTRDLIDGIASGCRIPSDQIEQAHNVREYRNSLVHLRDAMSVTVSVAAARGHLCRFLSHLPQDW